jgi:hypothetical protein
VYTITGFQPARVMAVDFRANPKAVVIQPCLMVDDQTTIPGQPLETWTEGGVTRLSLSR